MSTEWYEHIAETLFILDISKLFCLNVNILNKTYVPNLLWNYHILFAKNLHLHIYKYLLKIHIIFQIAN